MPRSRPARFAHRRQFFIRVTVSPQRRQAEHVPWATTLDEALGRAKILQGFVNRLRGAGQLDFVEKLGLQRGRARQALHDFGAPLGDLVARDLEVPGTGFSRWASRLHASTF